MPSASVPYGMRAWLVRLLLSAAIALCAGLLVFLVARGIGSVMLFMQEQRFLAEVAGAMSGGIEGLGGGDLRAVRLRVEQLDAQYYRISILLGLVGATLAAILSYLRLERTALEGQMS